MSNSEIPSNDPYLNQQDKKMEECSNLIPMPVVVFREDGKILDHNSMFAEVLCLNPKTERIIGDSIGTTLSKDFFSLFQEIDKALDIQVFLFTEEVKGKKIDFYVKAKRFDDENEGVSYFTTFEELNNITRKFYGKNHDRNLLRTAIDILPSFIYAKDLESRYIMLNQVLSGYLTGGQPEEILGKTDFDFYPHRQALKFYCDEQEVLNSGKPKIGIVESASMEKERESVWLNTTKVPLLNDEGEIIGIVGSGIDITSEKRIRDHLKELEEIVNNSNTCALIVKIESEWEVLYHTNNLDVVGFQTGINGLKKSYLNYIHTADRDRMIEETINCFKSGEREMRHEYRIVSSDGDIRWVEDHKYFRSDEDAIIFQSLITDITKDHEHKDERDRLEMQLRQAQKLESIGQLAAGISHEINTPIQFVNDNLKFLFDSFQGLTEYVKFLETKLVNSADEEERKEVYEELDIDFMREEIPIAINQSIEGSIRVRDIVKAMKEFSHSGSGDIELIDINSAIESTVTVARNEWKYVSDVNLTLDKEIPKVPVDTGPFKQTILNLIVNSAHSIADRVQLKQLEKGEISITTTRMEKHVLLTIKDTGMGIPDSIANRVYDPFFTTKEVGKGTGQGLAIAHDIIVRKLKGKLYFETKQGEGTTFYMELPLADEDQV